MTDLRAFLERNRAFEEGEAVASLGGGVNSVAMIIRVVLLQLFMLRLIMFADTGGEKPETYEYVRLFSEWLQRHGQPAVVWVKRGPRLDGRQWDLEAECVNKSMLPAIAYGDKACSIKYKIRPQDVFMNNYRPALVTWRAGRKILRLIGYDAGESHRAKVFEDDKYVYRFPLIEAGMGRADRVDVITAEGLPVPPKSACFFCPSSKKADILRLRDEHPELLERALHMESNARLYSIKGLGRRFSWNEFIAANPAEQAAMPDCSIEQACACYDGTEED